MTMLVLHQAVPPHFTTQLRPWVYCIERGNEVVRKVKLLVAQSITIK